jgi:probable phosphoglycerate mutase
VSRHGTTVLNQEDCFRGPLDPDLDKKGWKDAYQQAYYMDGIELGGIFTSPKKRSHETAKIVKGDRDIEIHITPNLCALDVGFLGGQKKTPETNAIIKYHVDHPDIPIEGGESLNQFRARVRPLLVDGVETALALGKPLLIVAHSSIVRETGEVFNGDNASTLVLPGGVCAVYIQDGRLKAEPIFKDDEESRHKPHHAIIT